jgi:hypothetical protein
MHSISLFISESRGRIRKRKGAQESIPRAYVACWAGSTNRQSECRNRFLGIDSWAHLRLQIRLRFWEGLHYAMPRKLQFLNRFTDLCIKTPKLVFTLQIGDHFFLNLNSVVNAVDPVLIMFRIFNICFYSSHAFFKLFLFGYSLTN